MTDDTALSFCFPAVGRMMITAGFDGGRLSSDGGMMLLAATERRLGLATRLARLVPDRRDPARITHTLADMIRARVFAICCGYADADDLDHLRGDPAFKLACGHLPETGHDLASQPTLSRLENAPGLRDVIRLRDQRSRLSRASAVAEPIDYMLRRCPAYARFRDDGRVCLSNIAAERALRGFALGRKAWLFAGSERGAEGAAAMATLIMTAELNDVDPQAWLADVLDRITSHPAQCVGASAVAMAAAVVRSRRDQPRCLISQTTPSTAASGGCYTTDRPSTGAIAADWR